ncbi:MAG TPA: hypothetical protein ENH16_04925, partial [Desulfobacteraceae bacterium]|nr:hypothetical protein [Desulfobacteraceae bacterium]
MEIQGRTMFILLSLLILSCAGRVMAGPYLNSVHGNNTIGVNRSTMAAAGYARGNCAHCHEQHASVNGSTPAGGPYPFTL